MIKTLIVFSLIFAAQAQALAAPLFNPPKGGAPAQTRGAGSR